MKIVTYNDIKEMNRLYYELGTFAAVARATKFSPATVRKYVDVNYTPPTDNIQRYEGPIPDLDPTIFRIKDWAPLCVLTDEEEDAVEQLWHELEC